MNDDDDTIIARLRRESLAALAMMTAVGLGAVIVMVVLR